MQVEMFMKENLLMIWPKGLESINTPMGVSLLAIGIRTSSMALAKKNGMMQVNIKVFIKMLRKKDKVNIAGLMVIDM